MDRAGLSGEAARQMLGLLLEAAIERR